jgi:hypothetical protein
MPVESKIPYVIYHPNWDPRGSLPIQVLLDEGIPTYLDEWAPEKSKLYYCPQCGVNCYKSPKEQEIHTNNVPVFFGHFGSFKDIKCSLRTTQGDSKRFDTETEKKKAVEDGKLTIIKSWRKTPDEEQFLNRNQTTFTKVAEDEHSPTSTFPIGRHVGVEHQVPHEISSLFWIGRQIEKYWGQSIQLPGMSEDDYFRNKFFHAHDFDEEYNEQPCIVWGLVENILNYSEHVLIRFQYKSHIITFKIPQLIVQRRRWTIEFLKGNLIMVVGRVKKNEPIYTQIESLPCFQNVWSISIEYWGQAAIITSKYASSLLLKDQRSWKDVSSAEGLSLYEQHQRTSGTGSESSASEFQQQISKLDQSFNDFHRRNRSATTNLRNFLNNFNKSGGDSDSPIR